MVGHFHRTRWMLSLIRSCPLASDKDFTHPRLPSRLPPRPTVHSPPPPIRTIMHRRFATLALLLLSAPTLRADTPKPSASPLPEVNLLAMGDWGRGNALQKTVSTSISSYVTSS